MRTSKLLILIVFFFTLTACGNPEDEAKKLGFTDVAEMKALQAKGFKNRKDYVENLLKDSGCDTEDELNHAMSEVNGNCNKLKEIRLKEEAEYQLKKEADLKLAEAKKNIGLNCMAEYAASIFVNKGLWDLYVKNNGFNRMNFGAVRIGIVNKSASYLTLVSNKDIGHSVSDNDEIWIRARKTAEANYNGLNSFKDLDNLTNSRTVGCINLINKDKQEYFFEKINADDPETIAVLPNFMRFPRLP